jgi:hypothetical protein
MNPPFAGDSLADCHAEPLLVANMTRVKPTQSITLLLVGALLLGCQVQFVSPYSADVQKRASDMIAEISAWELQMREAAGTPDADPRQPNIKAKFANWDGELEAMAAIETALAPETIKCDSLAAAVTQSSRIQIPENASSPIGNSSGSSGAITHQSCETKVFQNLAETLAEMQQVVERQCQLPWLSEGDFQRSTAHQAAAALQGSAATSRAISSAPSADQQRVARERCAAIFRPTTAQGGQNLGHGVVVGPVIGQLYDIVYIETRKSTAAAKS